MVAERRVEYFTGNWSHLPKQVVFTDKFGVTITSPRGTQFIPNTRTETVSTQLVQGSQNKISQTSTSTPDLSNQMSSIITGVMVGAAGIAGMYAVKPSVKQFVNTATQKDSSDSETPLPKKSEVEFKYSSDTQSQSDVKIVDISAIIKQAAGPANTRIGAGEATFIQPDDSTTDTESGNKESKPPETTIGPAPKDAIEKIKAQENKKIPTFKEMDKTQLDGMDKTATQIEGINTLFFGGPLYLAVNKFSKWGGLALSGFQLFNKGLLLTGQIPLENELNMNGDMGRAAGHEIATLGTGMLVPLIPFIGPAITIADACGSAITGISIIEETVRVVENGTRDTFEAGFDSGYNRTWDATAPKIENLENYMTNLEKSIQESKPGQRSDKMQKLLHKIQGYKSEMAKRKSIREFNTKMFNREFTSLEP